MNHRYTSLEGQTEALVKIQDLFSQKLPWHFIKRKPLLQFNLPQLQAKLLLDWWQVTNCCIVCINEQIQLLHKLLQKAVASGGCEARVVLRFLGLLQASSSLSSARNSTTKTHTLYWSCCSATFRTWARGVIPGSGCAVPVVKTCWQVAVWGSSKPPNWSRYLASRIRSCNSWSRAARLETRDFSETPMFVEPSELEPY